MVAKMVGVGGGGTTPLWSMSASPKYFLLMKVII